MITVSLIRVTSRYLVKMCKQQIVSPISVDRYLDATLRKAVDFDKQTKTVRFIAQRKLDAARKCRSLRVKVSEPQIGNNKITRNLQRDRRLHATCRNS